MKPAKNKFKNLKHKRISLLGMSGVGKTHIANILRNNGDWFHYSGDYRIGSRYLDEHILDNIKYHMMQDELLRKLLISDSIYISNNITFENLLPISSFLGKVGNPDKGGLPLDEFIRRQKLHHDAEVKAMLDVPDFIKKAQDIYNYPHFVNDAGGSISELEDNNVLKLLAEHTIIIYIKASHKNEKTLINRAISNPKPLYYKADFFKTEINNYLQEKNLDYVAQINPDDFVRWIFPKLFYSRIPRYEKIAKDYGIVIESDKLHKCKTVDDFYNLIEEVL